MTLKSEYPTPLSHSITIAFELKQETYGRWYGKEKRTGRRPELVHKFVFGVDYGKTGLNWVKNNVERPYRFDTLRSKYF